MMLGREPSFLHQPSHVICFLLAFCLVRSDSIEASELSGHMRYNAPATIVLNAMAALYKMRSLSHVADVAADLGGAPRALICGTLAFSACNALMAAEAWVLVW